MNEGQSTDGVRKPVGYERMWNLVGHSGLGFYSEHYGYIYSFMFGCTRSSLLRGLSPVAVSGGSSLVAVHGLLIAVVSLTVEHRHTG